MTTIASKISLYGDSTTAGHNYGPRMMARSAKILGVNDYSRGGNSFADNLAGADGLFGGLSFQQHVSTVDDADICLIRLGTNSAPFGWITGDLQACLDADYLTIASDCLQHVQIARAAGKRVVLVGTPYMDIVSACAHWGVSEGRAVTDLQKVRNVNTAIRCVGAVLSVPVIATHGFGGAGGHPAATSADVPDGVHPTVDYANAVADYLADQVVALFAL